MEENSPRFGIMEAVQAAVGTCSVPAGERGAVEWMDLVSEVSQAMTVLTAARDAAIVRLAAIEEVVTEDGVIGDQVNGLGTVCLDAGAMVATATGTSTRFAQEMVDHAVTRVVRVPSLHDAMLTGTLDDYKARCVGGELRDVPPDLARTVVDALGGDFASKSGPALRRRTRDILFRLAPELLKERIRKSRSDVSLRRWAGEPGTDAWGGVFPSERAAKAWAAIDELARQYRLDGTYATLEQARAFAMLDLVDGNATVETVLHLTVPAGVVNEADGGGTAAQSAESADDRSAAAPGRGAVFFAAAGARGAEVSWMPSDVLLGAVRRGVVVPGAVRPGAVAPGAVAADARVSGSGGGSQGGVRLCHPGSGALLDVDDKHATDAYRPGAALKRLVRARDGRCRFPGCVIAARQCDIDHVIAWPSGPTSATNLICLCRRHHRVKQRHRWRVRLRGDGVVEWLDPRGRTYLTEPVDHLGANQRRIVVLDGSDPAADGSCAGGLTDDEVRELEVEIETDSTGSDSAGSDSAGSDSIGSDAAGSDSTAPGAAAVDHTVLSPVEQSVADMIALHLSSVRQTWGRRPGLARLAGAGGSRRRRRRGIITLEDLDRITRAGLSADDYPNADDALDAIEEREAREELEAERECRRPRFDYRFCDAATGARCRVRYRGKKRHRRQSVGVPRPYVPGGPPF